MSTSGELDPPAHRAAWKLPARVLGILAVATSVFPAMSYRGGEVRTEAERAFLVQNPDAAPSRSDFTLVWSESALVHYYSEATLAVDEATGASTTRTSGMQLGLLSWSTAGLVLGLALLWIARSGRAGAASG